MTTKVVSGKIDGVEEDRIKYTSSIGLPMSIWIRGYDTIVWEPQWRN